MFCAEMPEARFEDVVVVDFPAYKDVVEHELDPLFLETVEPGSVVAVSATCSQPVPIGVEVSKRLLVLKRPVRSVEPATVTVKLSGVRLGRAGKRFPRFSDSQMQANSQFWLSVPEKAA